jgi:hypothetical protein
LKFFRWIDDGFGLWGFDLSDESMIDIIFLEILEFALIEETIHIFIKEVNEIKITYANILLLSFL